MAAPDPDLPPPPPPPIIVVGGGLAGLSAALEAATALKEGSGTAPPSVLVLEAQQRTGGNSAKASSGVSAVREAAGVAAFAADLLASSASTVALGGGDAVAAPSPSREAALRDLAAASPGALAWLEARSGVDLTSRPPSRLGGHSDARTYGPSGGAPVGFAVMSGMGRAVEEEEVVAVRTGSRAVGLVMSDDGEGGGGGAPRVAGVIVEEAGAAAPSTLLPATAVILTTGGFAACPALLARHAPALASLPTTNGPWAAGEGVRMGEEAGAAAVDMGLVQVHPTAFLPSGDGGGGEGGGGGGDASPPSASLFLAPERLRGVGGVLVNAEGARFADELSRRDSLAAAVAAQPGGCAWLVLSPGAVEAYGAGPIAFYEAKGLMRAVEGVDGLARVVGGGRAGVADTLRAALADHDAAAAGGDGSAAPDAVGRTSHAAGPFGTAGPFHAGRVCPALHYTMGGLAIDGRGRVLARRGDEEEEERAANAGGAAPAPPTIPGLYAAGEVTGGVHGANRLGGCSLLECVVVGRAAGRAAVEDLKAR